MKQKIFLIPLLLSLISASSSNFIYVKSNIRHEDIYCKKQLQNYHSKTITTLSNIKKLPVAKLTFNYELYQMYKPTEVQINYHPGFILLYQADIYVNNAVEYKGGVGNWFDGKHAGFLNYINFNAEFRGIDYTGHSYQCPGYDSSGSLNSYRYLRDVNPTDTRYTENSYNSNKQTQYNGVTDALNSYHGDKFQDCTNLFTNSYFDSVYDIYKDLNLINHFDTRLVAYITSTISRSENDHRIAFNQRFDYNNNVSLANTKKDNTGTYFAKVTEDSSKLFSGPCTNGTDDSKPFNFAFYGCFAVESSKVPDSIAIELKMDTFHGSHTALDKFESSAYDSFVIQLS